MGRARDEAEGFAQKVWDKITEQFATGEAARQAEQAQRRNNRIDEINRQLEEGNDPNKDIFEKDPFRGSNDW